MSFFFLEKHEETEMQKYLFEVSFEIGNTLCLANDSASV